MPTLRTFTKRGIVRAPNPTDAASVMEGVVEGSLLPKDIAATYGIVADAYHVPPHPIVQTVEVINASNESLQSVAPYKARLRIQGENLAQTTAVNLQGRNAIIESVENDGAVMYVRLPMIGAVSSDANALSIAGKWGVALHTLALPTDISFPTGGDVVVHHQGYRYHYFTGSGSFEVTGGVPDAVTVDILIVGGGGGGGSSGTSSTSYTGGGGAGGLAVVRSVPGSCFGEGVYAVVVGAGGAPNASGSDSSVSGPFVRASDTYQARGGVPGILVGTSSTAVDNRGRFSGVDDGTSIVLWNGGIGVTNGNGGGGGAGAGGDGGAGVSGFGGSGGAGLLAFDDVAYGGGGGGSVAVSTAVPGTGGEVSYASNAGFSGVGGAFVNTAHPGTKNRGEGGGGRGFGANGGAPGGSGIVVVRYPVAFGIGYVPPAPTTQPALPLGGTTIVEDFGGYRYHYFTSSGSFEVIGGVPASVTVDILIVGGGGGGGSSGTSSTSYTGGGGAGGLAVVRSVPGSCFGEGVYAVVVGAGGAPNASGSDSSVSGPFVRASDTYQARGGVQGILVGSSTAAVDNRGRFSGVDDGISIVLWNGGTGVGGGNGGGGGAGAGGDGGAGVSGFGGSGGAGLVAFDDVAYGGGGGGAGGSATAVPGTGGDGGGGTGGGASGVLATSGVANTGGGGGGRGFDANSGGSGGSGIVVLRYLPW